MLGDSSAAAASKLLGRNDWIVRQAQLVLRTVVSPREGLGRKPQSELERGQDLELAAVSNAIILLHEASKSG